MLCCPVCCVLCAVCCVLCAVCCVLCCSEWWSLWLLRQVYVIGGVPAGSGRPTTTVDILFPYEAFVLYPSPYQLTSPRCGFSGFVGPDGNITVVGGDGGGTSEEISTCAPEYIGPECDSCNFGYVAVDSSCVAWYVQKFHFQLFF